MEEGHEGNRHSTQVASTLVERKLSEKNKLILNSSVILNDIESYGEDCLCSDGSISPVGLTEGYGSDSEGSSNGFTDKESDELLNCDSNSLSGKSNSSENFEINSPPLLEENLSQLLKKEVYALSYYEDSIAKFIQSRIEEGYEDASFLVTNLTAVLNQFIQWKQELPMVEPFYAVKCNPDPVVVQLLASVGCNFDCATMGEIDLVLNGLGDKLNFNKRGLASTSIVYANPAKMNHMLEFALHNDVLMTVFDGEDELYKIAALASNPNNKVQKFELLLRLTTDDRASICRFSKKFGCPVEDAPRLLKIAKELNLNVAGVSFHVGSGCGDSNAYKTALSHAKLVFDEWARLEMPPLHIVDLGGGFPGDTGGYGGPGMPTFQQLAEAIRNGITQFKSELGDSHPTVRFIAEPGRYFVSASTVIATKVYARKGGMNNYQALYVDDGVYGSFNNVVYDHANPLPLKLRSVLLGESEEGIPSAVFGPTCDGLDQMCSLETTSLPRCQIGDWLIWENQGAYTHTASFVFNGYTHVPKKTYCAF